MIHTKQEVIEDINRCLLYSGRIHVLYSKELEDIIAWGNHTLLDHYFKQNNLSSESIDLIELPVKNANKIYQIICNGDHGQFLETNNK